MEKKLKSGIIFITLVAFLGISWGTAFAKRLKVYALYPEDSFITQGIQAVADRVKKETNGAITMKVFPSGQLGGYDELMDEVRMGTIECGVTYPTKRYDPRLDLVNLPGLTPTGYDMVEKVFFSDKNSPLIQKMDAIIKDVGLVSLGPWPEPLAGIGFSKGNMPENINDFKNKNANIRVPAMPLWRDAFKELGYQTLTMAFSELFSALQTGQIDGSSGLTAETTYLVGKDIVKDWVQLNAHTSPGWFVINKETWESFTDEQRKIFQTAVTEEGIRTLSKANEMEQFYIGKMKEHGINVVLRDQAFLIKQSDMLRTKVWPAYADLFGKAFLNDLDNYIKNLVK